MRGSKNSKLATLAKLAKGVREAGAKMKMRMKKFCREGKNPSKAKVVQPNLPMERSQLFSGSPGFKIYEEWEPFQLNIGQPSNLNPSPRLPSCMLWSREECVANMASDKSEMFIWRVSGRNNTVEKLSVMNRDVYQHSSSY